MVDEDVVFTYAAKGGRDKRYDISQPFTVREGKIMWGEKRCDYHSRSEARKAIYREISGKAPDTHTNRTTQKNYMNSKRKKKLKFNPNPNRIK